MDNLIPSSVLCATFASQRIKHCSTHLQDDQSDIEVSPWIMSIDKDHQVCTLKLTQVDEMDVGSWGCSVESLAEMDGKYQMDSANVILNLVQPPKLSIEEAIG